MYPYDNRAHLLGVGDRPPSAAIDGAGICVMAGSSPRFYIDGQWQNIEMSSDIFIGKSVKELLSCSTFKPRGPA
jgi:hypothetical protein